MIPGPNGTTFSRAVVKIAGLDALYKTGCQTINGESHAFPLASPVPASTFLQTDIQCP